MTRGHEQDPPDGWWGTPHDDYCDCRECVPVLECCMCPTVTDAVADPSDNEAYPVCYVHLQLEPV